MLHKGKAGILQSALVWHSTQTPAVVQMGAAAPQSAPVVQPTHAPVAVSQRSRMPPQSALDLQPSWHWLSPPQR
jgi:hypothetical protein